MSSNHNLLVSPNEGGGAARRARAKTTILVAEDNPDSREMMEMLLRTKGYEVVAANDGVHAVEVAVQTLPDLILIDLQLPKLDGLSVTRTLRQHPQLKTVPIIIISGHDPEQYRQTALAAGCSGYLLKPIDFDRLDSLLRELIAEPAARPWI